MNETSSRTLTCCVLCAELADYARLPAGEQLQRRRRLAAQVAQELVPIPMAERVVQELEAGVLIAFLAEMEGALAVAVGVLAGGQAEARFGLAFGTVHVVKDVGGRTLLVGDGANDAQRASAQAAAGQALATAAYRDVASRLSAAHASVFGDVADSTHGFVEVRIPGGGGETRAPARRAEAASIFDAGPHLMISGYERDAVQKALEEVAAKGGRIISPVTRVGDKWMASCEHPDVRMSECKVEKFGLTTVVTGPTRQAVEQKVEELVERGARLQGQIERDGTGWTAVCDSGGG